MLDYVEYLLYKFLRTKMYEFTLLRRIFVKETSKTSLMISPSGRMQYTNTFARGTHDASGDREKYEEAKVPATTTWPRDITYTHT